MQAREWPRAAEQEVRIALSIAPDLAAAQIAVANLALARHRYAEARQRIASLVEIYPENLQVQSLQRQLAADTGWLLETEAHPANERGGGAFGNNGNELVASMRITSPLIGDSWQLFVGYNYANAHPPEGYVDRQRAAFGLQFISPDVAASVSVHQDFGTLSRTGASGTLDWGPSDQLGVGFAADYISMETPLRALLFGITANSVSARATYTWDNPAMRRSALLGYRLPTAISALCSIHVSPRSWLLYRTSGLRRSPTCMAPITRGWAHLITIRKRMARPRSV